MNVTKHFALAAAAMMLVLAGCPSEDEKVCSDFCGAGSACVGGTCQAVLTCSEACAADQTCVNGACTATVDAACSAGCAADQVCVVADDAATCVSVCGPSQQWNATSGQCEIVVPVCDPACGTGEACQDGACVPTLESACSAGCEADQVCVTATGTATCMDVCSADQVWNPATSKCETAVAMNHAVYFSGFAPGALANGPAVTAECLRCHAADAAEMAGSAHFKWLGPTPFLAGHETDTAAVGKKNLVNNFCIAVASNEARCSQCHAGYGNLPAGTPAYNLTGDAALARVDCLICHADLASSRYVKSAPNWGAAFVANTGAACSPACAGNQYCNNGTCEIPPPALISEVVTNAAKSIGRPKRDNCGFCHFSAGGADNVKMGDLGSPLKAPTMALDVHMGSTATGGQGYTCVDCHVTVDHRIYGTGVSVAVSEGPRTACTDCHDTAADAFTAIGTHTAIHLSRIACQTCHVPTFSRGRPTKMDWDWSNAGHKDWPVGATVYTMASGATVTLNTYDWMKGTFVWQPDVQPEYRWSDGTGSHMTILDAFTAAGTDVDPIVLAAPLGARAAGGKIAPYKEMRGTQAAMTSKAFVIVPHLFGADGFWDTAKIPNPVDAATLQAIWNDVLSDGAFKAGQPTGLASEVDFADADWFWAKTRMYMSINHEVAPKDQAIGYPVAGGVGCADCHGPSPVIPICEIYAGTGHTPHDVTCP